MTLVCFVRHGQETEPFGTGDAGLSDLGKREVAERAGAALDAMPHSWSRVLASPYRRTRETAQLLSSRLVLDFEVDHTFEELPQPAWETSARPKWQRRVLDTPWPDQCAEMKEFADRLVARISKLTDDTIIVTHFGTINFFLSRTLSCTSPMVCKIPTGGSILFELPAKLLDRFGAQLVAPVSGVP